MDENERFHDWVEEMNYKSKDRVEYVDAVDNCCSKIL